MSAGSGENELNGLSWERCRWQVPKETKLQAFWRGPTQMPLLLQAITVVRFWEGRISVGVLQATNLLQTSLG